LGVEKRRPLFYKHSKETSRKNDLRQVALFQNNYLLFVILFYFRLFQVRACVRCVQVATPLITASLFSLGKANKKQRAIILFVL